MARQSSSFICKAENVFEKEKLFLTAGNHRPLIFLMVVFHNIYTHFRVGNPQTLRALHTLLQDNQMYPRMSVAYLF